MADTQNETQQAETISNVRGKLAFSLNSPTPIWMTWVFRVEFFLNKALMMWVASTDIIPTYRLKTVIATFTAIDFFVWGIGRSIGVKPPEDPNVKP